MVNVNINLYGYATSPFVQKVYTVLRYKQLDFQTTYVNPINNEPLEEHKKETGGGRQVPVLNIDNEWRRESTDLCFWLQQLFPQQALLPDDPVAVETVKVVCDWVDKRLIFANFLALYQLRNPLKLLLIGWRLGSIVKATSSITTLQRYVWPLVLKKAKFIQHMVEHNDWEGSLGGLLSENRQRLQSYLQTTDYLCSHEQPTIADCCAFGPLAHAYMLGSPIVDYYLQMSAIDAWFKRMSQHFERPFGMFPPKYHRRALPMQA